jgi:hypothetical protein
MTTFASVPLDDGLSDRRNVALPRQTGRHLNPSLRSSPFRPHIWPALQRFFSTFIPTNFSEFHLCASVDNGTVRGHASEIAVGGYRK